VQGEGGAAAAACRRRDEVSDRVASRAKRSPATTFPLARLWRTLYEVIYLGIESVTRLLFRPLFRVRLVGPPLARLRGGVVLCPNHQSYLDPALLQLVVPRRVTFLMTNDFYAVPGARGFFRLVGALPMARGRMAWASLRRAAALLRLGAAVVVFPEGRLSPDGRVQEFQRGIGALARRGRAPVVPVAIDGSIRAWPKSAKWLRCGDVRIAVGAPIDPPGAGGRAADEAFSDAVRTAVVALKATLPPPRP
jgi:1-acyl-sn-glycerol-3-phosphate acyltransferase